MRKGSLRQAFPIYEEETGFVLRPVSALRPAGAERGAGSCGGPSAWALSPGAFLASRGEMITVMSTPLCPEYIPDSGLFILGKRNTITTFLSFFLSIVVVVT